MAIQNRISLCLSSLSPTPQFVIRENAYLRDAPLFYQPPKASLRCSVQRRDVPSPPPQRTLLCAGSRGELGSSRCLSQLQHTARLLTPLISTNFIRDEAQIQLLSTSERNNLKLPTLNTHFLSKLPKSTSVTVLKEAAPTLSQSQHLLGHPGTQPSGSAPFPGRLSP